MLQMSDYIFEIGLWSALLPMVSGALFWRGLAGQNVRTRSHPHYGRPAVDNRAAHQNGSSCLGKMDLLKPEA